jgi:hypothetical protein
MRRVPQVKRFSATRASSAITEQDLHPWRRTAQHVPLGGISRLALHTTHSQRACCARLGSSGRPRACASVLRAKEDKRNQKKDKPGAYRVMSGVGHRARRVQHQPCVA